MDLLIKNASVLSLEPDVRVEKRDIAVANGVILEKMGEPSSACKVIDASGKLVIPGLINCHTHMYMSIFRNYADDLKFDDWLFGKIMPAEDQMQPEDAYWCNLLSCIEMVRTGTTCFLDMHMFKNQCLKASQETGMRAVLSRGLVGGGRNDEGGQRRIDEAFEEIEAAKAYANDLTTFRLAPHAIYTCDREYLKYLAEIAKEKDMPLHVHLSETKYEFDSCMEQNGMTPVRYLESLGIFDMPTVAAHGVYLTDDDIGVLRDKRVSVATCPVSNMKLANGFAPVTKLMRGGVNVCIGTDGASSNNALNMFREMAILSYTQKGVDKDAQSMTAPETLRCATINGAKALGLADKTGSLKAGMRADLAILDLDRPQFRPLNNLAASLVYSANGSEVETVVIDGKVVMEKNEVKTVDEERVYFEVERIGKGLLNK